MNDSNLLNRTKNRRILVLNGAIRRAVIGHQQLPGWSGIDLDRIEAAREEIQRIQGPQQNDDLMLVNLMLLTLCWLDGIQ